MFVQWVIIVTALVVLEQGRNAPSEDTRINPSKAVVSQYVKRVTSVPKDHFTSGPACPVTIRLMERSACNVQLVRTLMAPILMANLLCPVFHVPQAITVPRRHKLHVPPVRIPAAELLSALHVIVEPTPQGLLCLMQLVHALVALQEHSLPTTVHHHVLLVELAIFAPQLKKHYVPRGRIQVLPRRSAVFVVRVATQRPALQRALLVNRVTSARKELRLRV